jgi:hypothetical protein
MTTVVILKILVDVGLYYMIAGFFAAIFGASAATILLAVPIFAVSVTLSYFLRETGAWRFAPYVLLVAIPFLPGGCLASLIAALPMAAYVILMSTKRLYVPEWTQQVDIFSLSWKILIVMLIVGLIGRKMQIVTAVIIPMAVISGGCSILLMRSLRHEPKVYCQKNYQIVNIVAIVLVGIAAMLLSSKVFLGFCAWLLSSIFRYVISPVLTGFIYIILGIVQGVLWLASFIKLGFQKPDDENAVELNLTSPIESFVEQNEATGDAFGNVLIALGVMILLILLYLLLKFMMARKSGEPESTGTEVRYYADPRKNKVAKPERSSAVWRVRTQYRRFLKLCKDNGIVPAKSDTTREINSLCRTIFDHKLTAELREIYINARYDGAATKEDAANAKKICDEIKKKIPK